MENDYKETINIRVSARIKRQLIQDAEMLGIGFSEHIRGILGRSAGALEHGKAQNKKAAHEE